MTRRRSNTACTALPACGRDVQAFGMADLAAVRIASWCWPSIGPHHRQRSRRALKPRARRRFKSCNLHLSELVLLPPGTLPRTSSGKMRRREAWRLWHAEELQPPGKAGLPTMLRQTRGHGRIQSPPRTSTIGKHSVPQARHRVLIVGGGPVGLATALTWPRQVCRWSVEKAPGRRTRCAVRG